MVATEATIEAIIAEQAPSANGWFQLQVPTDGLSISVKKIVRHTGEGKPVETRDILKKLKGHKVIYGVDVNAIESLLKLVELNQIPEKPVVIAKSDVTQGKDGKLEWCIDGIEEKGAEIVVAADMQIAILLNAIKGSPGKNVFGKMKQPRPIFDPQLNNGIGICVEEQENGEFIYKTEYAGELKFVDGGIGTLFIFRHRRSNGHVSSGRRRLELVSRTRTFTLLQCKNSNTRWPTGYCQ